MENQENDFRQLMRRAAAGDQGAAKEIVQAHGETVLCAVQRLVSARLRSKYDALDFVQIAWFALFRAPDRMAQFNSPAELAAFLIAVARNAVRKAAGHQLRTGEYSLDQKRASVRNSMKEAERIADSAAAAIDEAIAHEELERLLSHQRPIVRKIIELRARGMANKEIALALHVKRGVVYRFLKRLLGKHDRDE